MLNLMTSSKERPTDDRSFLRSCESSDLRMGDQDGRLSGSTALVPANKVGELSRVDPIDFLFTIALAIGLTPELIGGDLKGILSEDWVRTATSPNSDEAARLLVFFVGLLTLTLSWFGYNRSDTK